MLFMAEPIPQPHTKKSLSELRLRAGYETQKDLADAANLGESTVWLAENRRTISKKSGLKILLALEKRGLSVTSDQVNWVIGKGSR
jgi:hypothetical protein